MDRVARRRPPDGHNRRGLGCRRLRRGRATAELDGTIRGPGRGDNLQPEFHKLRLGPIGKLPDTQRPLI